ncbi:unnamed protein product [Brachionus calyciflorus]|uniref:Uncharacterized protein n=1 Tax=Brachionus calyciflorus TaxID=104777 RepID=A0A813T9D6_9BILA|nr:unnamed protein product [Brachionus calyciflorus]
MANLLFKSNIESNFIVNNKKSPNNFKSYNNLNFLKVKSNLKQTATSAATKYASVACVDQYQIEENSSDNDTDDLNGDLSGRDTYYNDDDDDDDNDDYDNNDDDDDNVFDCCEATLVKEKCSTKKKTSSCHVVFNSNIKITIRKVDQLVPKKKIISKN